MYRLNIIIPYLKVYHFNAMIELINSKTSRFYYMWLVMSFWDEQWKTISIFYGLCGLIIFGTTLLQKTLKIYPDYHYTE